MRRYCRIAQAHTLNVLDVAKAVAILPSTTEPPAWIGDRPGPWPADELLVTKIGIVHLPSIASGLEDYTCPRLPGSLRERARLRF